MDDRVAAIESDYATETDLTAVDDRVAAIESDYATETDLTAVGDRVAAIESDYATDTGLLALEDTVYDLSRLVGYGTSRVFVTVGTYTPATDFSSLEDADQLCQDEADAQGLDGTWMAWLSDSIDSPSTRFNTGFAPYALLDGTELATDWDDLTDNALATYLDVAADGSSISSPYQTWTGTKSDGTSGASTCSDWSSTSGYGIFGSAVSTNYQWSGAKGSSMVQTDCWASLRLFCFEQ